MTPEELLERLAEGKVYVPIRRSRRVTNFFRKGNLIALREFALRQTAERVDAQMRPKCAPRASTGPGRWRERILVCVSASPLSAVSSARGRAWQRALSPGITAYVETPAPTRLPQAARDRVVETLRLAEQLGLETVTLSGPTLSEEILAYAWDRNVSKIVIGKPRLFWWWW